MTSVVRHRGVLVVVALALLAVGLLPLLRANAAARQRAWEADCVRQGAAVSTDPPDAYNPLIAQTGHTHYRCQARDGRVLSTRD